MKDILDYPEMKIQLIKRLEEVGFDMKDWHINNYHSCPENHWRTINNKEYDSYDYIYVINKTNRKDVFYLWIDYAWTVGMKDPVLYILYRHAEDVETDIDSLNGNIEDHFTKYYNSTEKTNRDTNELEKKYSLKLLPEPKNVIKEHVSPSQYKLILEEWANRKKHN